MGTAPTRRELENVKEAVREHYIFGREVPRDLQFYEYAGQWYKLKKEPFISNASRSNYKTCLMKHLVPAFGMQHMKAISAAQLQEFINGYAGKSKSQINNIIGHTDYQTTANIYMHLKEETLRKATVNMEKVFASRSELKSE